MSARLRFARRVTRRQGEVFREWMRGFWQNEPNLSYAFERTGIIAWPAADSLTVTPAQERYLALEDEILRQTFRRTEDAIISAFVSVAREVIARERRRRNSADA